MIESTEIGVRRVTIVICWLVGLTVTGCGLGGGGVMPVRTAYNKGVYHYSRGDLDAAVAEYRIAVEEDNDDFRARFNLAVALEAQADRAVAQGDRSTAEDLRAQAGEHYSLLLAAQPDLPRVIVNLAANELVRGQRDQALERLRVALERFPDSALPPYALAAHEFRAVRDPSGAGEIQQAVQWAEEARRRNPASVEANMLLGDLHAYLSRQPGGEGADELSEEARGAYLRVLETTPEDVATLLAVARLEMHANNDAAAASRLEQVLFIDSDHWNAHILLSQLRENLGDWQAATLHLWYARDLDRSSNPRLSAADYRQRLLRLYAELVAQEQSSAGANDQ